MLQLILSLVLLLIIVAYLSFLFENEISKNRKDRVIYYSSNLKQQGKLLEEVIRKYVPDVSDYALIEPGAGLGRVSQYLATRFPWKEVIAVECMPVIFTAGRLRNRLLRTRVRFVRRDIFAWDMPKPAVVYCYLFPQLMEKLYKEGQLEGRLVISLTFAIPDVTPTEKVEFKGWQSPLWVYDFRK